MRSGKGEFPWAPLPVREIDEDAEGIDEAPSLVMLMRSIFVLEKNTENREVCAMRVFAVGVRA